MAQNRRALPNFDVANKPWENYGLISRVLIKTRPDFYEIISRETGGLTEQAGNWRHLTALFENISDDVIKETILKQCLRYTPHLFTY